MLASEISGQDLQSQANSEIAKGRLLTCAGLAHAATASGGVLPAVCLVQIAAQFELSDSQCGQLFAICPTVTLVTLPMFGLLGERWGKRGFITLGMSLLMLSMALFSSANDFAYLVMGCVTLGLAMSIVDGLMSPLLIDLCSHRSAAVMNMVHACFQIGLVVTAVGGGAYLAYQGQWSKTFWPVMILAGLLTIVFAVTRFPPALVRESPHGLVDLLGKGPFWLCAVVIAVAGGVEAGIICWVPSFLQRTFDLTETGNWMTKRFDLADPAPLLAGIGVALFAAPMVLGRGFYGAIAERFGYLQTLGASCAISTIALVALGQASTSTASILWLALLGLALSGMWPTLLIYAGSTIHANPPTLFALLAMAGLAGVGICSWAIGQMAESYGLQASLSSLVIPIIGAMLALLALSRK